MAVINGFKQCPRCKQLQPTSSFSPDKHQSDGFASNCKGCQCATFKIRQQKKADAKWAAKMEAINGAQHVTDKR